MSLVTTAHLLHLFVMYRSMVDTARLDQLVDGEYGISYGLSAVGECRVWSVFFECLSGRDHVSIGVSQLRLSLISKEIAYPLVLFFPSIIPCRGRIHRIPTPTFAFAQSPIRAQSSILPLHIFRRVSNTARLNV